MLPFFDAEDEVQFSEHELAWMHKDWDAVKALSEEYKQKPENLLFAVLNGINSSKADLSADELEGYSKFMVDSMLSRHADCLPAVMTSNMFLSGLDDIHHYNYLKLAVPQGRRFAKTGKLDESLKDRYIIALLCEFYKVNPQVAFTYRKTLENKGNLEHFLKRAKAMATDSFLKTITKNPKEIKELKSL